MILPKGTGEPEWDKETGIGVLNWRCGVKLSVYVDADYADKADDRRSVSGVQQ